jgi:UDP-glucose 4-epimerase
LYLRRPRTTIEVRILGLGLSVTGFRMTRVLISGVAGFIGSHVARHCLDQGFEVIGIDDLSGGSVDNVPAGVVFRLGTIVDHGFLSGLWDEGKIDYVYHLAAYAAEGLSHFIRRFNYTNNLIGSVNLINQSVLHRVKCFVFTSSIAVYGESRVPLSEDVVPRPQDPYGIAKYAVEMDLAAANHLFQLPYIVFRPHNVYGERQNIADKYRNVVGIFMNQVMSGKPMTIFGDGQQTRAFSYINDVAPIIARSPLVDAAYGEVFNIGADQPCTVLEVAREVASAFEVEPRIHHLPPRKEAEHAISSHQKLNGVFGRPAAVPLPDGIRRMAEWVRQHGPARPVEFADIEVPVNLPPSWLPERS